MDNVNKFSYFVRKNVIGKKICEFDEFVLYKRTSKVDGIFRCTVESEKKRESHPIILIPALDASAGQNINLNVFGGNGTLVHKHTRSHKMKR